MVYVSGAKERNEKWPPASVVTDAVCEGDVALTIAPATGEPVSLTTWPLKPPVVPARTQVPWTRKTTSSVKAKPMRRQLPCLFMLSILHMKGGYDGWDAPLKASAASEETLSIGQT